MRHHKPYIVFFARLYHLIGILQIKSDGLFAYHILAAFCGFYNVFFVKKRGKTYVNNRYILFIKQLLGMICSIP